MEEKKIYINCISDYVKYLEDMYNEKSVTDYLNIKYIFRGQGNMEWGLTPSLLRGDKWKEESAIILDSIRKYPKEFQNLNYNNNDDVLKILTILQHYGLPTRLLDFTEDPLVALYFACETECEKNGEIFIVKEYKHQDNTAIINSIIKYMRSNNLKNLTNEELNYLFKESTDNLFEGDSTDIQNKDSGKFTRNDLINIRGAAVLIEPYLNNDRIIAQKGLFYLCGMEFEFSDENETHVEIQKFDARNKICYDINSDIDINQNFDEENPNLSKTKTRLIVPAESKNQILHELDSIYRINRHSVYPEVNCYAEYMIDSQLITQRLIERDERKTIDESFEGIVEIINQVLQKTEMQEIGYSEEEYKICSDLKFTDVKGFRDYSDMKNTNIYIITYMNFILHILVREKSCFLAGFKYNNNIWNFSIPIEEYNQDEEIIVDDNVVYFVPRKKNKPDEVGNDITPKKVLSQPNQYEEIETFNNVIEQILSSLINESKYVEFNDIKDKLENCLNRNLLFGRDEDIAKSCIEVRKIIKERYPTKFNEMYQEFKIIIDRNRENIRKELK